MSTYYVDHSATNDGDGTAHTQAASPGGVGAWNEVIGHEIDLLDDDVLWIRRVSSEEVSAADWDIVANVDYNGWPKSGDANYADRPAAAQAAWDGDANDYPLFFSAGTYQMNFGANVNVRRCQFRNTVSSTAPIFNFNADNAEFWNCLFDCTFSTSSTDGLLRIDEHTDFYECTFDFDTTVGSYLFDIDDSAEVQFVDCDVTFQPGTNDRLFNLVSGMLTIRDMTIDTSTAGVIEYDLIYCDNPDLTGVYIDGMTITSGANARPRFTLDCRPLEIRRLSADYIDSIVMNKCRGCYVEVFDAEFTDTVAAIISDGPGGGNNAFLLQDVTINSAAQDYYEGTDGWIGNTYYERNVTTGGDPDGGLREGSKRVSFAEDATDGYWRQGSSGYQVYGSDTYRTGGAAWSLWMQLVTAYARINIGDYGKETIAVQLASGTNTLTLFGAHKNFTNIPDKGKIYFELTYFDNGAFTRITSKNAGVGLVSDASVWVGDTGLTEFSTALTTASLSASAIGFIRLVNEAASDAGSYVYLDPVLPVT